METFTHGVLSGIGHPLLGFDHMFFVIAVGVAAAMIGRLASAPLGYLAGMMAASPWSRTGSRYRRSNW